MYTRTFERTTINGVERIIISEYGYEAYLDGQFMRDGLVDNLGETIDALLEADFEEVDI